MDEILTAASVVDVALPPLRSSSRASSQPSIDTTKSASASDGKLGCEPAPVMEPHDVALPPSRSSSEVPSRRTSCSMTPSASISSEESFRYQSVPAKDWFGIYPPVLPPPDFFDLEEEEKWVKEEMFKKDNIAENRLYDETGEVNLPVDEKGVLILDPVSRTRIIDVLMEEIIFGEYRSWIDSAIAEVEELGAKQSADWLKGLRAEVQKDYVTVDEEGYIVIDEERKKRGLTDWKTHMDWWNSTGRKQYYDGIAKDVGHGDEPGEVTGSQAESRRQSGSGYSEKNGKVEDETSPDVSKIAIPAENEIVDEHTRLPATPPLPIPPIESTAISQPSPTAPPLDLFAFWS